LLKPTPSPSPPLKREVDKNPKEEEDSEEDSLCFVCISIFFTSFKRKKRQIFSFSLGEERRMEGVGKKGRRREGE
jgi:hypothetical protein